MEEIFVIVFCLLLNALFAAYEMAFVSVGKSELRALARTGNKKARVLLELRENPERTLSVIQIGITLVGAIAAAVGGAGAVEDLAPHLVRLGMKQIYAQALSVLLVVLPLTYLSVVVGELVPKSLALKNPKKIVLAGAKALFVADRTLSPLVSVLEWSTKFVLKMFFRPQKKDEAGDEQTSLEIESLSPVHRDFVINMANIEKRKVRDISVPWSRVISAPDSSTLEEVTQVVLTSGHTRLPILNAEGHVAGVLHTKEFMSLRESGEKNWRSIVRPALAVRPTDSALGVLRLMQEKRSHMCIVFSATGERLGIVTLEDVLEEVVGDIFDEDDDGRVRKIFAARARDKSKVIP